MRHFLFIAILGLLGDYAAQAQPNPDKSLLVEGTRIYADVSNSKVYYVPPAGIALVKDKNATPDLKLIMMRYTGRRLSADQQKKIFKNLCQFRVMVQRISAEKIAALKASLGNIELKSLPLSHTQSYLVYTPIVLNEQGFVRSSNLQATPNGVADEQFFTITLSNEDAQLIEKSFQQKQTLVSIGYAFFAEGISTEIPIALAEAPPHSMFKEVLKNLTDSLQQKSVKKQFLVSAGALEITPPLEEGLFIRKIDINEQLPAEYAAFDVRCYDFNNELRPELYAKKVEIEAIAIDDKPTIIHAIFYKNTPDISSKNIKFNYAIKLDQPLRYRITEINHEGQPFVKGWIMKPDWGILDITGK